MLVFAEYLVCYTKSHGGNDLKSFLLDSRKEDCTNQTVFAQLVFVAINKQKFMNAEETHSLKY